MTAAAFVVALSTFLATGSIWKALGWTVLTLIVLQVGYFLSVVRLIYRAGRKNTGDREPRVLDRRDGMRFRDSGRPPQI
ncbi:exopolysaccharide production repressor protein [Mesorhizobium sp.]|uniref:exopolysaccharide production repressor protein n=1 Tax=Mesorhizobium sp. TaxID=1871066 RepID=UPI002579D312|nr:exopolysaccharide production repressor protein [Mesorhizobium sp.]